MQKEAQKLLFDDVVQCAAVVAEGAKVLIALSPSP
jgi:hypothetical protein